MKRTIGVIIAIVALITANPTGLLADDVDIYGGTTVTVQPNVLFILDNSYSMNQDDVPGALYDPATTYDDYGYQINKVYERVLAGCFFFWCWYEWVEFTTGTDDVDDLACNQVKTELQTTGFSASYQIQDAANGYQCGGTERALRLGNYLNFIESGLGDDQRRIDVAQTTVKNLIDETENVNFGLMVFNDSSAANGHDPPGGEIIAQCGEKTDEQLKTLIDNIDIGSMFDPNYTPLAESMAEAGLYFAGKNTWYNGGEPGTAPYDSPMEYTCQQNYVILMTDGEPTKDDDSKLWDTDYIFAGQKIGDYDTDDIEDGGLATVTNPYVHKNWLGTDYAYNGTDFLDDVAKLLYDHDLDPTLGDAGSQFETQNITTYTIGFKLGEDAQLMVDTAVNGGGQYYTADNATALSEAFENIMAQIEERNAVFVAPVVPVNRMNKTFAGNRVYLGFFRPKDGGRWSGNIKKYGLTSAGVVIDQTGSNATGPDGKILSTAWSYWSAAVDGPDVEAGGLGERINTLTAANRNLYTFTNDVVGQNDLNHPNNHFADGNPKVTDAMLGNPADRTALFDEVYGVAKPWILADFIHSEPGVVHYWDSGDDANNNDAPDDDEISTYIFAGSNGGMLHCFDDSDGNEKWGFIPPDQLSRLQYLTDGNHTYFVDGSPVIFQNWTDSNDNGVVDPGEETKILLFGSRRGGTSYHALDITDPLDPQYLYEIDYRHLRAAADKDGVSDPAHTDADLGQSWTKPEIHTVKIEVDSNPDNNIYYDVFLLAGGYDANQDADSPAANDDVGKAAFTVNVTDGDVETGMLNFNGVNYNQMTNSIVDMSGFDSNGDHYLNRVYAGDLNGHLFAFRDDDYDGTWEARKLFEIPDSITVDAEVITLGKKFLNAPDMTREDFGDFVFIGTGDREHPLEDGYTDAIYAIKNTWADSFTTLTITGDPSTSDLYDATENHIQQGTDAEKALAATYLGSKKGWFIRMPEDGEKIVSSPRVFAGVVYFTTYTPPAGVVVLGSDPCEVDTDRGIARLYALNWKNGAAATESDGTPGLTKDDRSVQIGTSIPSAPVIAVLKDGARILVGVEGGIQDTPPSASKDVSAYYWRQLF